jgi:hypothetical protein
MKAQVGFQDDYAPDPPLEANDDVVNGDGANGAASSDSMGSGSGDGAKAEEGPAREDSNNGGAPPAASEEKRVKKTSPPPPKWTYSPLADDGIVEKERWLEMVLRPEARMKKFAANVYGGDEQLKEGEMKHELWSSYTLMVMSSSAVFHRAVALDRTMCLLDEEAKKNTRQIVSRLASMNSITNLLDPKGRHPL